MDPTRDNLLIRIKAFFDGLGILTFFALILLVILGAAAWFGWYQTAETPEDAAGEIRYTTKAEIDAAQKTVLTSEQINSAINTVGESLVATKAAAVKDPKQLVPGSETALKLAEGSSEPIDPAQMEIGKAQFLVCGACHGQNGEGGLTGPPLAGSEWVTGPVSNLITIQLRGLKGPIEVKGKVYDNFPAGMMAMSYQTDEQIAGVLTYIRNSFGNKASAVKPEEVTAKRGEVGKPQVTVEELIKP